MRACRMMARMTSRTFCALLCAAALLSVTPGALRAQTTSPNTKLLSARALYYTPTTQGLKSFHCTVDFDWKDFLTRYSGADVKDDSPYLQYLRTIHLAVSDELSGDGKLEWTTSSATPEGKADAVAKIRDGMQQMMVGFFSSWNGYMNGNMVPAPDATTTVTENGDVLRLHAAAETTEVTELFDKNLLLTEAHVVQPASDVLAYPTYVDTPDGRVISSIRTVFRQPPTAPPAELNIRVSYTPVQNFRIPDTLSYELKNVGSFEFKFSACSVETTRKAPDKAPTN
jgi:hypothetical protein